MQQNDVPACHSAQNALGKSTGIRGEGIKRPNAPRNVFEPGIFKKGREKRMTQAHRRAE